MHSSIANRVLLNEERVFVHPLADSNVPIVREYLVLGLLSGLEIQQITNVTVKGRKEWLLQRSMEDINLILRRARREQLGYPDFFPLH